MKLLPLVTLIISVWNSHVHGDHNHITDFITSLLEESVNKNVIYLIIECQSSGHEFITEVAEELQKTLPIRPRVIITSFSKNTLHPMIYTTNLLQLQEALLNYACTSSITSNNTLKMEEDLLSTISNLADKMFHNDIMLVFPFEEHEEIKKTLSLTQKLKDKQISVNVILNKNSKLIVQYRNLTHHTGGRFLTYNINHKRFLLHNQISKTVISNHTIKVVKKNLIHDARITFALPEDTYEIFVTMDGIVRKALMISHSGTIINILPQETKGQFENSATDLKASPSTIHFKLPIFESPVEWTLSASGNQYNVTTIIITKFRAKNRMHRPADKNDPTIIKDVSSNSTIHSKSNFNVYSINSSAEVSVRRSDIEPVAFSGQNKPRIDWDTIETFTDSIITNFMATNIEVDPLSTFYELSGAEARIIFNVRNNKIAPNMYSFYCFYMQKPCLVRPLRAVLEPQQLFPVFVTVRAEGSEGSANIVELIAENGDIEENKVYLYIGKQPSDNTKPDIDYEYNGDCDKANTGGTCHLRKWRANLVAKDYESGLLNFWSEPFGLVTSEFVVGTKDAVIAYYTASCCDPKIDILASDLRGNTNRVTLNIEHQYLSAIEITAIALGAILISLIVIALIYGIIRWRRKRNETAFLSN